MKKSLLIAIASVVLVIAVGLLAAKQGPLRTGARRAWKELSISGIAQRVADPRWPASELARLNQQSNGTPDDAASWLSSRIILMRNGDWLAYANTCNKEDGSIYDFFLGRGSDGRWYYSTYHFCKDMLVLRTEDQSMSLAAFEKAYYLRPFDGQSDECLQKTWPPQ